MAALRVPTDDFGIKWDEFSLSYAYLCATCQNLIARREFLETAQPRNRIFKKDCVQYCVWYSQCGTVLYCTASVQYCVALLLLELTARTRVSLIVAQSSGALHLTLEITLCQRRRFPFYPFANPERLVRGLERWLTSKTRTIAMPSEIVFPAAAFLPPLALSRPLCPSVSSRRLSQTLQMSTEPSRRARGSGRPTAKRAPSRRDVLVRLAATSLALLPLSGPRRTRAADASAQNAPAAPAADLVDPAVDPPVITDRVYFDVRISNGPLRRFVVECYGKLVPATVANFVALAKREAGEGGFAGTDVYRIVPGLTVQMGDVLRNGGRAGASVDGGTMAAETAVVKHSIPGLVSMARGKNGGIDSRFFVTTRPGDSGYLDVPGRQYVAFGRVEEGFEVLLDVEAVGARGGDSKPLLPIRIVDCGVL